MSIRTSKTTTSITSPLRKQMFSPPRRQGAGYQRDRKPALQTGRPRDDVQTQTRRSNPFSTTTRSMARSLNTSPRKLPSPSSSIKPPKPNTSRSFDLGVARRARARLCAARLYHSPISASSVYVYARNREGGNEEERTAAELRLAAAAFWTTTQLPNPPAVLSETRHLFFVAPPWHAAGSAIVSCSEPTFVGFCHREAWMWSAREDRVGWGESEPWCRSS